MTDRQRIHFLEREVKRLNDQNVYLAEQNRLLVEQNEALSATVRALGGQEQL